MGPYEQQMTAIGCVTGASVGGQLGLFRVDKNGLSPGAELLTRARQEISLEFYWTNRIGRLQNRPRWAPRRQNAQPLIRGIPNHGAVVMQSITKTSSGSECKQITEVASIQGRQVEQPMKYCWSGPCAESAMAS
jgi:hypothetical protein